MDIINNYRIYKRGDRVNILFHCFTDYPHTQWTQHQLNRTIHYSSSPYKNSNIVITMPQSASQMMSVNTIHTSVSSNSFIVKDNNPMIRTKQQTSRQLQIRLTILLQTYLSLSCKFVDDCFNFIDGDYRFHAWLDPLRVQIKCFTWLGEHNMCVGVCCDDSSAVSRSCWYRNLDLFCL